MCRIETKDDMLHKPTEVAFYTTRFGFMRRDSTPSQPLDKQFIWMAKLTAKPGKRDAVLEAARIHTGNVDRDEKETYSFVVLESQDNDVDVLLFERYSSEKYFKEVHFTSDSMQEYRGKVWRWRWSSSRIAHTNNPPCRQGLFWKDGRVRASGSLRASWTRGRRCIERSKTPGGQYFIEVEGISSFESSSGHPVSELSVGRQAPFLKRTLRL